MNIDIKSNSKEDLVEIIKMAKKLKVEDQLILGSFKKIDKKDLDKNILYYSAMEDFIHTIGMVIKGVFLFKKLDFDVIDMPWFFDSIPYFSIFEKFPRFY